jgi:Zn finger protein HypA/HybF involved in hydrogenase expression
MRLLFGKKKKRDWRPQLRCPRCGSNNVEVIGDGLQSYDSLVVTDVLGLGNTDWMS